MLPGYRPPNSIERSERRERGNPGHCRPKEHSWTNGLFICCDGVVFITAILCFFWRSHIQGFHDVGVEALLAFGHFLDLSVAKGWTWQSHLRSYGWWHENCKHFPIVTFPGVIEELWRTVNHWVKNWRHLSKSEETSTAKHASRSTSPCKKNSAWTRVAHCAWRAKGLALPPGWHAKNVKFMRLLGHFAGNRWNPGFYHHPTLRW